MWCKSTIRPGIHNCLGKYFRNGWRLGGTDPSEQCLASDHSDSPLVGAFKAWLRGVGAQNGPPFAWLRGARSKTGRLFHGYGVRGPKRAAFFMATGCAVQNGPPFAWLRGVGVQNGPPFAWLRGVGAQNGPPFAWLRGVGAQNGPPFAWLRGVGAQNGPPFAWLQGVGAQNGPPFTPRRGARSKTGRLFHADSLRGENGGLFFTVLGCAVKTAPRFSQFLGAR